MNAPVTDVRALLAKEGIDSDELGGVPVALPADVDQVVTVLALAAKDDVNVIPTGLGGKLTWCRPEVFSSAAGLLLSTRRLDAVTDYVAGDGTLTAQAGCRMSTLAKTVHGGGHRLTPDVPSPSGSTLGGVLGSGQSGPDRTLLGPARHHVLGMQVVLADGTRAKTGGRLVKNVTGFDLHRLYTGSRGTLCVIVEASLRLFPIPEQDLCLTWRAATGGEAVAHAKEILTLGIHPRLVTVENTSEPGGWCTHAGLSGRRAQVAYDRELVVAAVPGADAVEGDDARRRLRFVRDLAGGEGRWPTLRLLCRPSRAATALAALERLGYARAVVAQPGVCSIDVFTGPLTCAAVTALQSELPTGVRLEPMALPAVVHAALAQRGADSVALRWMRELAGRLDPDARLASPSFPPRP